MDLTKISNESAIKIAEFYKKPIVFFDIESTGLDVDHDQIIQIALHKVDSDGVTRFLEYCMPDVEIKKEAQEVHGISLEYLQEINAPKFKDIADDILKFIDGCALSGYNIKKFDLPLLENEINRTGLEVDLSQYVIIDVQNMYRRYRPHKLVSAFSDLTGSNFDDAAHDAGADVDATIAVCAGIIDNHPDEITDLDEFANDGDHMVDYDGKFIKKDGEIVFNFGKDFGRPVKTNLGLLNWMLSKDFKQNTKNWARKLRDKYSQNDFLF
jgi:DNA polymerase-3 subunit epsilon